MIKGKPLAISVFLCFLPHGSAAQQHFVDETSARLPQIEDVTTAGWFVDVDGDGDLDLIVENRLDRVHPSYVVMNDGTALFPADSMRTIIDGDHWFSYGDIGDVDNDGDYDVTFANDSGFDWENSRIFINDGRGNYADETETRFPWQGPIKISPQAVFLDCNSDILLDILFAYQGWEKLLMNIGNGFYDWDYLQRFPRNSDDNFSVREGDIDGDFDIDVIMGADGGDTNLIYVNEDGFFIDETPARMPINTRFTTGICLADIDGDKDLDLITAHGGFSVDYGIYINNGEGYFTDETEERIPLDGVTCTGVFFADVDNDADFDILVTTDVRMGNQMTSRLFINNAEGFFTDETDERFASAEDNGFYASFGDIDNDGDVDLIVCNMDPNDHVHPIGKQNRLLINVSTPDSVPPVIAKTLDYHDTGDTTNAYIISTLTWDNISVAAGELRLSLSYKTSDAGSFTELAMHDCGGFIYRRDIPAQPAGTTIEYYVKAADKMGNITLDPQNAPDSLFSFLISGTGIEEEDPEGNVPKSFSLFQNYPNPFNPSTTISFSMPGDSGKICHVRLLIYDIRGKLVRELIDSDLTPGSHSTLWNGSDERGDQVPSGVYFYRLSSGGDRTSAKKMTLVR